MESCSLHVVILILNLSLQIVNEFLNSSNLVLILTIVWIIVLVCLLVVFCLGSIELVLQTSLVLVADVSHHLVIGNLVGCNGSTGFIQSRDSIVNCSALGSILVFY